MHILILGGTIFLGRHLVDSALARGHSVTLFNRGQHSPELYPEVEKLRGDRDGGLDALRGRSWDAVIDTCGYVPRIVRDSVELLRDSVQHYTFISSISVYADASVMGMDESAAVGRLDDPTVETVDNDTYGPLKALCEEAIEAAMPSRALSVRAGLIVGPHDKSDRFTYWPRRVAEGGEVLVPGRPDRRTQFIDVGDLAEWTVRMAEKGKAGVYNATGPDYPLTFGQVMETCESAADSGARFTWMDEKFLLERKVEPWTDLPLWIPEGDPFAGYEAVDCQKAIADGLRYRPLEDTVAATLAWDRERGLPPLKQGLARERESELLAAWTAAETAA